MAKKRKSEGCELKIWIFVIQESERYVGKTSGKWVCAKGGY